MNNRIINKVTRIISIYIAFLSLIMLLSYIYNIFYGYSHLSITTIFFVTILFVFSVHILINDHYEDTNLPELYTFFLLLCNVYHIFRWTESNHLSYMISGFIMTLSCLICSSIVFHSICSIVICINIIECLIENGNIGDMIIRFLFFSLIYLISYIFRYELVSAFNDNKVTTQKLSDLISEQDALIEEKLIEYNKENQQIVHLGRLSNSVIHDISSYITTSEMSNIESKSDKTYIKGMEVAFIKIKSSIDELRRYNNRSVLKEEFNLKKTIEDILRLGNFFNKNNINLHISVDSVIKLFGNKYYFKCIILNLILNAVESMSHTKERKLDLSCIEINDNVVITIKDSGVGISQVDIQKIFKPFHTTKDSNLGIGLYLVKKYVEEEFGGSIKCNSEHNAGTTFEITLNKQQCPSSKL